MMKEVAYPYAAAVFEYAYENKRITQWQKMLSWLSELLKQPIIRRIITNPLYTSKTQADVLLELSQDKLDREGQNFIRYVAKNHRLIALPDIQALFEYYVAEIHQRLGATVLSAFQLDEKNQNKITLSLKQKFNREVRCKFKTDPTLLGGVMVRIGDKVIDGSLKGKLANLSSVINGKSLVSHSRVKSE